MNRSPIFVAGVPRSANTWMQVALSLHPRIHITGHPPKTLAGELSKFHEARIAAGRLANQWNESHDMDHFAGANTQTCSSAFADYLSTIWTGYGDSTKPRWGMKILWPETRLYHELWPDAKWIICIRHPWNVIESVKNTLDTKSPPKQIATNWVESVRFGLDSPNAFTWQIDLSYPESRAVRMVNLLRFIGEPLDAMQSPLLDFVAAAPIVHKRTHKDRGTWKLDKPLQDQLLDRVDGLKNLIKEMGYTP